MRSPEMYLKIRLHDNNHRPETGIATANIIMHTFCYTRDHHATTRPHAIRNPPGCCHATTVATHATAVQHKRNKNNESRDTWPRPAPQKIITQEFDGVEDLLCLVQMVQKPVRVSPCPIEVLARSDLLPWDVNLLGWSAQWIKPVIGFLEHFYFLAGNHDVG